MPILASRSSIFTLSLGPLYPSASNQKCPFWLVGLQFSASTGSFIPKSFQPKVPILATRSSSFTLSRCLPGSFGVLLKRGPWGVPKVSLVARGLPPGRLRLQMAPFACVRRQGFQTCFLGLLGLHGIPTHEIQATGLFSVTVCHSQASPLVSTPSKSKQKDSFPLQFQTFGYSHAAWRFRAP